MDLRIFRSDLSWFLDPTSLQTSLLLVKEPSTIVSVDRSVKSMKWQVSILSFTSLNIAQMISDK